MVLLILVALLNLVGLLVLMITGPITRMLQVLSISLEEWFPLPLTFDTFVMWLIILFISSAGGIFGIAVKHYQAHNWKLGWEDLTYYIMTVAMSVFFLINAASTPPSVCFAIPAGFNGGLGVVKNMYNKRANGVPAKT